MKAEDWQNPPAQQSAEQKTPAASAPSEADTFTPTLAQGAALPPPPPVPPYQGASSASGQQPSQQPTPNGFSQQGGFQQIHPAPPAQPVNYQSPPPPPRPPAGAKASATPPPHGKAPRKGLGWPLAVLILGIAAIGGCCYSFANFTSQVISASELTASQPSVGVLVMEDEIYGSVWATDAINKFQDDPNIKSVVIRINSPGGAVAPCQEIYTALKSLDKPVIASMGSVAASGGLYVAAAADHIMANPGTITGSIGVIMQSVEVAGAMDKLGLTSQTIKSGEFKDMGSPFRPMKANERVFLQKMVDQVYEQFLADLTAGRRNMKAEDLRKIADGRIFTGAEAKEAGLVDELGGFEDALIKAADLGGLPPHKRPELVIADNKKSWWEALISSKSQTPAISLPPALTPGFSLKYIYQPNLGPAPSAGN